MISWVGFRQTYVEYERDERFAGESKYPLKKMIKFASDGIIAFSTKPLRLVMTMGFVSVFISILVFFTLSLLDCLVKRLNPAGLQLWLQLLSSAEYSYLG